MACSFLPAGKRGEAGDPREKRPFHLFQHLEFHFECFFLLLVLIPAASETWNLRRKIVLQRAEPLSLASCPSVVCVDHDWALGLSQIPELWKTLRLGAREIKLWSRGRKVPTWKEGVHEQGGRIVPSEHGGAERFLSVRYDSKCGPQPLKGL